MNQGNDQPNSMPPPRGTCPFHLPKRGAGVSPYRSHLVILPVLIMTGGVIFLLWDLARIYGITVAVFGIGLLGSILAMRRLERTSESLQQSEGHIRAIIDSALDAVVTMDQAGVITDWNHHAEIMFGWPRQEILGRKLSETIIPPRYREAHERGLQHFVATGEGPVLNKRVEITASRRNGEEFAIELSVTPLKVGAAFSFAGFVRDISESKAAKVQLEKVHQQLVEASRRAGMAEMATGVLHNVGNVLNSVNVATSIITATVRNSKTGNLSKAVALMREHASDLGHFLTNDPKGRQLTSYLGQLADHLDAERTALIHELQDLAKNVEHIKDIVSMQQDYAKTGGMKDTMNVTELVEDSLRLNSGALERHDVKVVRDYAQVPPVLVDKHRVLQILVNLVRNAKYACAESSLPDKQLTLRVRSDEEKVRIAVIDNGVGIPAENLTRIFNHGFTTKKDGHGFGLHSGALAAKEMHGSLTVRSDGVGRGAEFTLELPVKPAGLDISPARETPQLAA